MNRIGWIILWIILGLLFVSGAIAQSQLVPYKPLIIWDGKDYTRLVFQMENGACLRGPLVFYDKDGKESFKLLSNVEYPTDCGKRGVL